MRPQPPDRLRQDRELEQHADVLADGRRRPLVLPDRHRRRLDRDVPAPTGSGNVCITTTTPLSRGRSHAHRQRARAAADDDRARRSRSPSTPSRRPRRRRRCSPRTATRARSATTSPASAASTSPATRPRCSRFSSINGSAGLGGAKASASGTWSATTTQPRATASTTSAPRCSTAPATRAQLSPTVQITIDGTAPATPAAPVLDPSSDTAPAGDNTTTVSTPVVTGTAAADVSLLTIYSDSTLVGTATPDASRNWRFTLPSLSAGAHSIQVKASDLADNASALSTALEPDDRHVLRRHRPERARPQLGHRRQRQREPRLERTVLGRRLGDQRLQDLPRHLERQRDAAHDARHRHELDGHERHQRHDLLLPGVRRELGRREARGRASARPRPSLRRPRPAHRPSLSSPPATSA